jgi:histidine triad (HIT) family protein
MSLDGEYDVDNLFARIARHEVPAARVFEDDETLAFMDVFPQSRGHVLVVHKTAPARTLLDIEPPALKALVLTVQRVARAVRAALEPDGLLVSQFNGATAGQTIFHLHFHIIPRWQGVALGRHAGGAMADPQDLADLAGRIAGRL